VGTTSYYVYIKTGSVGTTLNLAISTTAPNGDGYNNSGDKVLAKFYNNGVSDIDAYSINQWATNDFITSDTDLISYTPTFVGFGTVTGIDFKFKKEGGNIHVFGQFTDGTKTSEIYKIGLPSGLRLADGVITPTMLGDFYFSAARGSGVFAIGGITNETDVYIYQHPQASGLSVVNSTGPMPPNGTTYYVSFIAPIKGWK
jgi:hypothetical protein